MTNAQAVHPETGLGDNKCIKFRISTKGTKYDCILQDRKAYERTKAANAESQPAESPDSAAESTSSSTSSSSASTKST